MEGMKVRAPVVDINGEESCVGLFNGVDHKIEPVVREIPWRLPSTSTANIGGMLVVEDDEARRTW
mgnify:CR=1 FL=1